MAKAEAYKIISTDFPIIPTKVEGMKKEATKQKRVDLLELTDLEISKYYWWPDGVKGMLERPIGKPKDYYLTKDDDNVFKSFIKRTLDKGRIDVGHSGICDTTRDVNHAEYIVWLYNNTQNQNYKEKIEKTVTELLKQEVNKQFDPPTLDTAQKILKNRLRKYSTTEWFDNVYSYHGASFNSENFTHKQDDQDFVTNLEIEAKKTERPITLKEVLKYEYDLKEKLIEKFNNGDYKNKTRFHFNEIPDDIKKRSWELYAKQASEEMASKDMYENKEFLAQFNRLAGLLEIVREIGTNDGKFAEIYEILKPKAIEKFVIDTPTLKYRYSRFNIYQQLLWTIRSIQPENDLKEFWINNLETEQDSDRLLVSVGGLVEMYKSVKDRKKIIPKILEILEKRNFLIDKKHSSGQKLLEMIFDHIDDGLHPKKHFLKETFYNFDPQNGTLDYLGGMKAKDGQYDFKFSRYTPKENIKLSAKYDVVGDSFEGNKELELTIRNYFEREGYELPNGIIINNIEGRKITDLKTKIVKPGQDLVGKYEGIINFGWNIFPFIYDENNNVLLMAEKKHLGSIHFQDKNKLDRIKKLIDSSQFMSLLKLGKKIDRFVEAEKKNETVDSTDRFDLYHKFSEDNYPPLLTIIKEVLIHQKKGLIE